MILQGSIFHANWFDTFKKKKLESLVVKIILRLGMKFFFLKKGPYIN